MNISEVGHKSSKPTEVYTHISSKQIQKIHSPFVTLINRCVIEATKKVRLADLLTDEYTNLGKALRYGYKRVRL